MSWDEFKHLAEQSGFSLRLTPGAAIVIPARMLIVEVAQHTAVHGVRWTVYGSEKNKAMTQRLLKTYGRADELAKSPLKELMTVLPESALPPAPLTNGLQEALEELVEHEIGAEGGKPAAGVDGKDDTSD